MRRTQADFNNSFLQNLILLLIIKLYLIILPNIIIITLRSPCSPRLRVKFLLQFVGFTVFYYFYIRVAVFLEEFFYKGLRFFLAVYKENSF